MPLILEDRVVNFGKTQDGTEWIKHETIFGNHSIAENIVEWSKNNNNGATFEKTTAWGLNLAAIARGETPSVALRLNERKLHDFLSQFGPMTVLCITEYGITLTAPMNQVQEAVKGKDAEATIFIGSEELILHRSNPQGNLKESILLGTITLSEEGFRFHSVEELEATLTIEKETSTEKEEPSYEIQEEDIILCSTTT
jgi:hypothetical protein